MEKIVRSSRFTKLLSDSNLPSKKTLKASEQNREDIRESRNEWRAFQQTIDPGRLVFLDESGLKTNMTRLYGRAYQGQRCHDTAPCGHWESVTILGSVRLDGTTESIVFEGAVDRKMFDEYIKEILSPTLRPGDIVIMDNLKVHKSVLAQEIVAARGACILYLPAYSPDYNPIEKMWSKVKQILRGIKAWTQDELFDAVGIALDLVSAKDAKGWFTSCGYIK